MDDAKECPRCDGRGRVSLGDGWTICPKCKGKKTVKENVTRLVSKLLDDADDDRTLDAGQLTAQQAVELLQDLGASFEHPGWINIEAGGLVFAFGDVNGPWGGNYGPPEDPGENGIEQTLPNTATPQELANYIRRSVQRVLSGHEN